MSKAGAVELRERHAGLRAPRPSITPSGRTQSTTVQEVGVGRQEGRCLGPCLAPCPSQLSWGPLQSPETWGGDSMASLFPMHRASGNCRQRNSHALFPTLLLFRCPSLSSPSLWFESPCPLVSKPTLSLSVFLSCLPGCLFSFLWFHSIPLLISLAPTFSRSDSFCLFLHFLLSLPPFPHLLTACLSVSLPPLPPVLPPLSSPSTSQR